MSKKQISLILIIVLVAGLIPQSLVKIHASNRSTSEEGVELIRSFEGFSSIAYKAVQSEQYYTIGYGHYGADVYPGMTVTREQAENILRSDIQKHEGYLNNFLDSHSISVNQSQYDALVSFTFTLGNVWVSTPTFQLKTYLINGIDNYSDQQITTAFTNWCKDGAGNVLAGLVSRRQKEANYFLRERNEKTIDAPQICAWISDDKMGNVPEDYKLGETYYLCYEVLDTSTGKRFENSNSYYSINETIYGPDGTVVNTCDYENSNNNWISYSTYTAGSYKGIITISGDFEGSVEVNYTLDEVKPQIRSWISKEKMGEETETCEKDDMVYLCYEMRDKNSGKKLNERIVSDYTVTETIYKPNGSVAYTFTYNNSDYNWIAYRLSETGIYKCCITVSGAFNGSSNTEVIVISPTTEPSKPTKPTAQPILNPTVTPIETPMILPTAKPTVNSTIKPNTVTSSGIIVAETLNPEKTIKPTLNPQFLVTGAAVTKVPFVPDTTPIVSDFVTMQPTAVPTLTTSPEVKTTATPKSTEYVANGEANKKDEVEYDVYEIKDEEYGLQEGDVFEIRSVIYEVTDTSDTPTVELVTIEKKNLKSVSVPATIKYKGVTYQVTGIAKNAFKNSKNLTSLTIGKNMTHIGSYAFYKDSKLKKITIKSLKLEKVQKKAFWGLSKNVTVKLPVSKKANYKEMLKKSGLGKW